MQSCITMHRRYHQQLEQLLVPNRSPSEQNPYEAMGKVHKRYVDLSLLQGLMQDR